MSLIKNCSSSSMAMLLAIVTRPSIVWPFSSHRRYPSPSKAPSKNALSLLPCTNWYAQRHTFCPMSWSFVAHSHCLILTSVPRASTLAVISHPLPTLSSGIPKGRSNLIPLYLQPWARCRLFNCRDEQTTYLCTIFILNLRPVISFTV